MTRADSQGTRQRPQGCKPSWSGGTWPCRLSHHSIKEEDWLGPLPWLPLPAHSGVCSPSVPAPLAPGPYLASPCPFLTAFRGILRPYLMSLHLSKGAISPQELVYRQKSQCGMDFSCATEHVCTFHERVGCVWDWALKDSMYKRTMTQSSGKTSLDPQPATSSSGDQPGLDLQ